MILHFVIEMAKNMINYACIYHKFVCITYQLLYTLLPHITSQSPMTHVTDIPVLMPMAFNCNFVMF
jgi:hypothetical protein